MAQETPLMGTKCQIPLLLAIWFIPGQEAVVNPAGKITRQMTRAFQQIVATPENPRHADKVAHKRLSPHSRSLMASFALTGLPVGTSAVLPAAKTLTLVAFGDSTTTP